MTVSAATIARYILSANLTPDDFAHIARAFKLARDRKAQVAAYSFRKGDKVEFVNSRNGLTIRATVVKVNVKTVTVASDFAVSQGNLRGDWKVAAAVLKLVA